MSTSPAFKLTRLATLKSAADFRAQCATLGIEIPCDDTVVTADSPLGHSADVVVNGKRPGNRIVIHPMEGWDGTTSGGISDEMRRRWHPFTPWKAGTAPPAEASATRCAGAGIGSAKAVRR